MVSKLVRQPSESEDGRSAARILAYVGPRDVRYAMLMLGAVKEGGMRFVWSEVEKGSKHSILQSQPSIAFLSCNTRLRISLNC